MYLYNEEHSCCPTPPVYQLFKRGSSYVVYTCKTKSTCNPLYNWSLTTVLSDFIQSRVFDDFDVSTAPLPSINQFSFSTCGKYLAVVTEDGYLRVFDYHRMQLYVGGFLQLTFFLLDVVVTGLFALLRALCDPILVDLHAWIGHQTASMLSSVDRMISLPFGPSTPKLWFVVVRAINHGPAWFVSILLSTLLSAMVPL